MPVVGVAYLAVIYGIINTLLVLTIGVLMPALIIWLTRKDFEMTSSAFLRDALLEIRGNP
jgi:hypothetical protein